MDRRHLGEEAMALANVRTMQVGAGWSVEAACASGPVVQADERRVVRPERARGGPRGGIARGLHRERVAIGRPLAVLYAPELVTAEEELLQAHPDPRCTARVVPGRTGQVEELETGDTGDDALLATGVADGRLTIHADVGGVVLEKRAALGDYLDEGKRFTALPTVQVRCCSTSTKVTWPMSVSGPNSCSRCARYPAALHRDGHLQDHPSDPQDPAWQGPRGGGRSGRVPCGRACSPRHRSVGAVPGDSGIVVPKSAVLWTGERSVVYVNRVRNRVVPAAGGHARSLAGEHQVMASGLRPGEEVVVNGTFTVDAAAQLNGAPSMMSPEGGPAPAGHQHGGPLDAAATGVRCTKRTGRRRDQLQVSGNCEMCKAHRRGRPISRASMPPPGRWTGRPSWPTSTLR